MQRNRSSTKNRGADASRARDGTPSPAKRPREPSRRQQEDAGPTAGLDQDEIDEVEARMKLRPLAVYEIVRQEGEEELERPTPSLWWSGLAAGLSIGFSLLSEAAMREHLPNASWRPLVENLGYAVGFLIVILGRQQLFTETTLTATLPLLAKPSLGKLGRLGRLWSVVFLANLAGCAIFGLALSIGTLGQPQLTAAAVEIAKEAVYTPPLQTFLRAIAAGWVMATLVWILPSSESFGFLVIALLTYLIALFDLAHVVAGSVEMFLLLFRGEIDVVGAVGFLVPALVGNIVGGAALFALLSYGQVKQEMDGAGAGA